MFCSNCGSEASGNFCSACGVQLLSDDGAVPTAKTDWFSEVRYDAVLNVPEVREKITANSRLAPNRMSGEQFLEACDEALSLVPGVSLTKIAATAHELYSKMGIKTGKSRTGFFNSPPGKVIAGILCSLARRGHTVRNVQQGSDGCLIEAAVSSDMWSFEGTMIIKVEAMDKGVLVEAETVVKGQLFDWGKSNRNLNDLFNDLSVEISTM